MPGAMVNNRNSTTPGASRNSGSSDRRRRPGVRATPSETGRAIARVRDVVDRFPTAFMVSFRCRRDVLVSTCGDGEAVLLHVVDRGVLHLRERRGQSGLVLQCAGEGVG